MLDGVSLVAAIIIGALVLGIGFLIGKLFCKEKKHEVLFYLWAALTVIIGLFEVVQSAAQNGLVGGIATLVVMIVVFSLVYLIYIWSKWAYASLAILVVLSFIIILFSPPDAGGAILSDFFKYGIIIGAKYKFLK